MTVLHPEPTDVKAPTPPTEEPLPPARVPSPLRNIALALTALLAITAVVFIALVFVESEPVDLYDSWMNDAQRTVQPIELHDSWMTNMPGEISGGINEEAWMNEWSAEF